MAHAQRLARPRAATIPLVAAFCAAAFVGATLVFLVQPMVVKMVLPRLGGSPAVWNTSMVFFQAVLLLGYAYAHVATRVLPVRRQAVLHLVLLCLPLLVLPIALPGWEPPAEGSPIGWLLALLAVAVGAPYLAVTTASPLLQRWFAATDHPRAADPYFLYAAGNAGSLLGLLGYPLLIEPNLTLAGQARLWSAAYGLFVLASVVAVALMRRSHPRPTLVLVGAPARPAAAIPRARQARWVLWAFVPSSLMLGATTHLSTDVAAVPLLWILPLSLYIGSFILVFGGWNPLPAARAGRVAPFAIALVAASLVAPLPDLLVVMVAIHLVALLVVALALHGRLADDRPAPEQLTGFFLLVSVGGVLGGVFNALVAPVVFDWTAEYPIALALALALLPRRPDAAARNALVDGGALLALAAATVAAAAVADVLVYPLLVGAALLLRRRAAATTLALGAVMALGAVAPMLGAEHAERTFFGQLRVVEDGGFRVLAHGTTTHGKERIGGPRPARPATYYHPSGPAGDAFGALAGDPRMRAVGAVGLGIGSLAAYLEPGARMTYFEIDPAVVRIARDARRFTFLADARGDVDIVLGDARLRLADAAPGAFGVLVLDAFSSDAIPVHLLTTQAFALYTSRLAPDGVLLVHISNRYLRLEPVVAAIAREDGLVGVIREDDEVTAAQAADGKTRSIWVALARQPADLAPIAARPGWRDLRAEAGTRAWTDDFSDVLSALGR